MLMNMCKKGLEKDRLSVKEVGEVFLAYYHELGHQVIPGSSLLSEALPMTFVMSAGMVQFEQLSQQPRIGKDYVLIQNCFRHVDLENVGSSEFHLSLFQMPGAFHFGAVDKAQTVGRIWALLTQEYGFDPEQLHITYFGGGRMGDQVLPADLETFAAWRSAGIPEERLLAMPAASNFWRQSARMVGIVNSQKCGPTSEVFLDRGAASGCGPACRPGCTCGRFVEILNNLYITLFIDEATGQIFPLEEPFTETVIGRERVAALLQGVSSVYEIDNLLPLVQQVRCFSKSALLSAIQQRRHEHLLVDHLRALLFLSRDEAPAPGKGGRSYIIRTLYRELLTSQRLLGITDPGFVRSMLYLAADLYPELAPARSRFMDYLHSEEQRFTDTLQSGQRRFEQEFQQRGIQQISGEDILRYEKRHGIPFSLLEFLLEQKHITYSLADYTAALDGFQAALNERQADMGSLRPQEPTARYT